MMNDATYGSYLFDEDGFAAAVEECEFLLTWNFRHIANVRIRREVERILSNHGYTKTTICTPEELIWAETVGRRSAPRGSRGAGLLRGGARLRGMPELVRRRLSR